MTTICCFCRKCGTRYVLGHNAAVVTMKQTFEAMGGGSGFNIGSPDLSTPDAVALMFDDESWPQDKPLPTTSGNPIPEEVLRAANFGATRFWQCSECGEVQPYEFLKPADCESYESDESYDVGELPDSPKPTSMDPSVVRRINKARANSGLEELTKNTPLGPIDANSLCLDFTDDGCFILGRNGDRDRTCGRCNTQYTHYRRAYVTTDVQFRPFVDLIGHIELGFSNSRDSQVLQAHLAAKLGKAAAKATRKAERAEFIQRCTSCGHYDSEQLFMLKKACKSLAENQRYLFARIARTAGLGVLGVLCFCIGVYGIIEVHFAAGAMAILAALPPIAGAIVTWVLSDCDTKESWAAIDLANDLGAPQRFLEWWNSQGETAARLLERSHREAGQMAEWKEFCKSLHKFDPEGFPVSASGVFEGKSGERVCRPIAIVCTILGLLLALIAAGMVGTSSKPENVAGNQQPTISKPEMPNSEAPTRRRRSSDVERESSKASGTDDAVTLAPDHDRQIDGYGSMPGDDEDRSCQTVRNDVDEEQNRPIFYGSPSADTEFRAGEAASNAPPAQPHLGRETLAPLPAPQSEYEAVLRAAGRELELPKAELRTFTDASGNFKIEARFVRLGGGRLVLEKADSTELTVPYDRISVQDQEWIRENAESIVGKRNLARRVRAVLSADEPVAWESLKSAEKDQICRIAAETLGKGRGKREIAEASHTYLRAIVEARRAGARASPKTETDPVRIIARTQIAIDEDYISP